MVKWSRSFLVSFRFHDCQKFVQIKFVSKALQSPKKKAKRITESTVRFYVKIVDMFIFRRWTNNIVKIEIKREI